MTVHICVHICIHMYMEAIWRNTGWVNSSVWSYFLCNCDVSIIFQILEQLLFMCDVCSSLYLRKSGYMATRSDLLNV